jgi:uncharacterized membrane protein (DUF485 family)
MKKVERFIIGVSVVLAMYAAYVLVIAFATGIICFRSHCARLGVLHQGFFPIAMMYGALLLAGYESARRAWRRLNALGAEDH